MHKIFPMRIATYFIVSILIMSACKEKSKDDSASTPNSKEKITLESQVMAIHDEVMPKMGDMHVAKKQLRNVMKESQNDSLNTEILKLITNLEMADEGMMDWMSKWNVPKSDPEKTEYLKSEKNKITKVKVDMLSSLEAANQFLSKKNK